MRRLPTVIAACLALTSCTALRHPVVPVDPEVTFAAHLDSNGLAVDRLERGRTASLHPAGWFRLSRGATYELTSDGQTVGAFWLDGSRVVARRSTAESASLIGRIEPSWDANAIQLAIHPAEGPAFRTDPFLRKQLGGGPDRLTRGAQTVIDLRGTYEATLRDERGVALGYLRVRISPYQPAPRMYDGVLPTGVPPALAIAAAAALDAEVGWIEDHALNVYRGSGANGPLDQSIPLSR